MAAVMMLAACEPKNASDIEGQYLASTSELSVRLQLLANNKYIETIDLKQSKSRETRNGRWQFDPDHSQIFLWDFVSPDDLPHNDRPIARGQRSGLAVLPVEHRYLIVGGLRIGASDGISFSRLE